MGETYINVFLAMLIVSLESATSKAITKMSTLKNALKNKFYSYVNSGHRDDSNG